MASSGLVSENAGPSSVPMPEKERRSPLPEWFPRRPLQDITAMVVKNAQDGQQQHLLVPKLSLETTPPMKKGISSTKRIPPIPTLSKCKRRRPNTSSTSSSTVSVTHVPSLRLLKGFR